MNFPGEVRPPQALLDAQARMRDGKEPSLHQIGLLARQASATGDMDAYIQLFTKVEPRLRRHFQHHSPEAEFLRSTGKVAGNINVFRKLTYKSLSGPVPAFEKIYRRNGSDLKRLQWVARHLWGRLPCQMPQIIEIVPGQRLSVVLFAFEPFTPVSPDGLLETLRDMNEFSIAHPASAFDVIEPAMQQMPLLYQQRRQTLAAGLALGGVSESELAGIEAACMDIVHVFNHADLHRFNVGRNGMIYDWDCACFAPAAHDPGRAIAALRTFRRLSGLRDFIQNRLGRDMAKTRSDAARIMFFYLVYAAKKKLTDQNTDEIKTLHEIFGHIRSAL